MPGRVKVDVPGRIGPLSDWSVELAATPHVATDSNPDTGVVNFTAPVQRGSTLAMNNPSEFTFTPRDAETIETYPLLSDLTDEGFGEGGFGSGGFGTGEQRAGNQIYIDGSSTPRVAGRLAGRVDSVQVSGISAAFTQSTPLSQFATGDVNVPAVTSGSSFGAFDLAWQLAGNRRNALQLGSVGEKDSIPNGAYWSLQGHEVAFNVDNKAINPVDETRYALQYADAQGTLTDQSGANTVPVTERMWKVRNHYSSAGWEARPDGIYSNLGTGSSVSVTPNRATVIMFTTVADSKDFKFNLGTAASFGFGPNQSLTSTGKHFTITISPANKRMNISGEYRQGGSIIGTNISADLYPLNLTPGAVLRVAIVVAFRADRFRLTAAVLDSMGTIGSVTTGDLVTKVDQWSAPWTHEGPMRSLYQYQDDINAVTAQQLVAMPYENSFPARTSLPNFGLDVSSPILQFTGGLWDYLCQVCNARQVNLRFDSSNVYHLDSMLDQAANPQVWNPVSNPQISIGIDNVAPYVDIEQSTATIQQRPVLYDALAQDESYSFTPGSTTVFEIETTSIGDFAYTPEPVDDIFAFRDTVAHPWGAFVITGADNLPIKAAEWAAYGGSVNIKKTSPTSLEMTVVCATVPGVEGDYSMSVSDDSNSYPCLRIIGQSGSSVLTETRRFLTGAEPVWSIAAGGQSVTNCAATSNKAVNTLAVWASTVAAGPSLSLSGSLPLDDIEQWRSHDMLFVPGVTIVYNNLQWRIMSVTVTNFSIEFSAQCYTVYGNPFWNENWSGLTVKQFTKYWEGKTLDDYQSMLLSGPDLDWSARGAIRRWTVYPAGERIGLTGEVFEADPLALAAPSTLVTDGLGSSHEQPPITVTDETVPGAVTYPTLDTTPRTTTITIAGGPVTGGLYPALVTLPSATYPGAFMLPGPKPEPSALPVFPDAGTPYVPHGTPASFPEIIPPTYPEDIIYPGSEEEPIAY